MFCTRSWAKAERGLASFLKTVFFRTQSAPDLSKAMRMSTTFVRSSPLSMAFPSTSGLPVSGAAAASFAPPDTGSSSGLFTVQGSCGSRDGSISSTSSPSTLRQNEKTCPVRGSDTVATNPSDVSTTVAFKPRAPSDFAP